jgi:hypothetical protein
MACYLGLDLGQASDYTALSILEDPPNSGGEKPKQKKYELKYLERPDLGTSYPDIVTRVKKIIEQPQLKETSALVVDATGVGRAVLDIFYASRIGIPIIAVTITGGNIASCTSGMWHVPKRDLVGALQVMVQNHQIQMPTEKTLPLTGVLKAEMMNFKAKINLRGHDSYEAGGASDWREGQHDDLVLSLALICWWIGNQAGDRMMDWFDEYEKALDQRLIEKQSQTQKHQLFTQPRKSYPF